MIVVDNGSTDATADRVRRHPGVELISLPRNLGAAARNAGARAARTPYVAFSDDDTWYAADAPSRMADLFDRHPRLAVITARILVGEACAEVADRARIHYAEADKVMSRTNRHLVRAPRIMEAAYRSVLERTMRRGFTPPRTRVSTGKLRVLAGRIR